MRRRDFLAGGLAIGTVAITNPANGQVQLIDIQDFIRWKFCPAGKTFMRRDVYTLLGQDPNHPIVQSYRDGVAVMRSLPATEPTSWAYQANIHGTTLAPSQWPPGAPFETCEHSSFSVRNMHFLPWHRMYLYFFEKIVRFHSGNRDFALPYWNYSKSGQAALPEPFRTPAGASNALYDATRSSSINSGNGLSSSTTNTSTALGRTSFTGTSGFSSSLEGTPHGVVHSAIGGNMGGFSGAGRDPIFWLHHCNVDRLWEKWLSQGGGRVNPIGDAAWMGRTATFVDECGHFVTMTNSDVLDTIAQLDYQYDDPRECIPLLIAKVPAHRFLAQQVRPLTNLVLANATRLEFDDREARLKLDRDAAGGEISEAIKRHEVLSDRSGAEVLLRIEELTLEAPMDGYFEVWLSLVSEETGRETDQLYVGNLNTFGADRASRAAMERAMKERGMDMKGGVSVALEVTEAVRKLAGGLDGAAFDVSVALRPTTGVEDDTRAGLGARSEPSVGSVMLEIVPRDVVEE